MNAMIKSAVAAIMLAIATPAVAGGITVATDGDSKLKLESLFYLNTYWQTADTTTAAGTVSTKTAGMAVDRAYFTAKYYFNSDWMIRFTTDIGREATLGKKQNIYLKYAYVEGKLAGDAAVLRLGQSHTPWVDYEQGLWGHRYVAKVMTDQYKFDDSSDLGIGLKGKVADGLVGYFVTLTNGSGYGNGSRTNALDYNARISLYPLSGLTLDAQYRNGYRGSRTSVANVTTGGVRSTLMQLMASYGDKEKTYRIGVNYIDNKDKAESATASTSHGGNVSSGWTTAVIGDEVKSTGYGLWGWMKFADSLGAFGRYERLENQLNAAATKEKLNRYLIGLEYTAIKGVDFSLVYDASSLSNRAGVAANERKDARYGLYSQVKF